MPSLNSTSCCGLYEFDGLQEYSDPSNLIFDICEDKEFFHPEEPPLCRFIIFTDTEKMEHGKMISKYIKSHNLGTITTSPTKKNPNSNNALKVFIWTINLTNLKKWYND